MASPQLSPIIVGKQGTEYKYLIANDNRSMIAQGMEVKCYPLKMCLRMPASWFLTGIPITIFDMLFPDGVNDIIEARPLIPTGETLPYPSLAFAKTVFTDLMDWNAFNQNNQNQPSEVFTVMTTCPAGLTFRLVNEGQDSQMCVDLRTTASRRCLDMSLNDDNTVVSFRSSLITRIPEDDPSVQQNGGGTNFRIPIQCSYPLEYNLDLFMGTYRNVTNDPTDPDGDPDLPDDPGVVKFDPPGGGAKPNCSAIGTADFANDPVCTNDPGQDPNNPGFYTPELGLFEIITILTPNGQSLGRFPVYMFIYQTEQYQIPYQNPPILDETKMLYVETGLLNPIEGAVLSTRECWATPTADRNGPVKFMLIQDFCLNDTAVQQVDLQGITNNGIAVKNRFQSKVFQFVNSTRVYLFCKVRVCFPEIMDGINGQKCSKVDADVCPNSNPVGRKRRSVEDNPYQLQQKSEEIPDNAESQDFIIHLPPLDIEEWRKLDVPIVMINPNLHMTGEVTLDSGGVVVSQPNDSLDVSLIYILLIAGCAVIVVLLIAFGYNFLKSKQYQS